MFYGLVVTSCASNFVKNWYYPVRGLSPSTCNLMLCFTYRHIYREYPNCYSSRIRFLRASWVSLRVSVYQTKWHRDIAFSFKSTPNAGIFSRSGYWYFKPYASDQVLAMVFHKAWLRVDTPSRIFRKGFLVILIRVKKLFLRKMFASFRMNNKKKYNHQTFQG